MSRQITITGPELSYQDKDGESVQFFDETSALAELLAAEVLFCNTGTFNGKDTVVLFINCNDLFAWGCADGEEFTSDEIEPLWRAWHADGGRGVEQWVCLRRKMRPQYCVIQEWKRDGKWTAALDALPERPTDNFGNPKIEPK